MLTALLLALVASAGVSHRATAATAGTEPAAAKWAAQTLHAGLTGAQAAQLQRDVDHYLAQGGTQVSANQIVRPDGSQLLVVVPGEKYARDLVTTRAPADWSECPYTWFCGWQSAEFQGTIWKHSSCGVYWEIPNGWNSGGSWFNHQSTGTVARMYGKTKNLVYSTPPANQDSPWASFDAYADWGPVWFVKVC
ncbi:hypothetical protein ACIRYZ_42905 [Kitasatospora sp. NPDC101155]|uniref:hypothetical protein n=1 Tax=Kitasatospora sp. NPDC101155 TaxID=3364097 RepID=UPI00380BA464